MKIFLTFDADFMNWNENAAVDELEFSFPLFKKYFKRFPHIKTTWFFRIDSQIEALFGKLDYVFLKYKSEIDWLQENGHEVGWHYHGYVFRNKNWEQNTDEKALCRDLRKCGKIALDSGLKSVRMGWGVHTNRTMRTIANMGFLIDSSAIPRPLYPWDQKLKDWSVSPLIPYHPSKADYRKPDSRPERNYDILEIPFSMARIISENDDREMIRYINFSFYHHKLKRPLEDWITSHNHLVTITHPYEVVKGPKADSLISFDFTEFEKNVAILESLCQKHRKSICYRTVRDGRSI